MENTTRWGAKKVKKSTSTYITEFGKRHRLYNHEVLDLAVELLKIYDSKKMRNKK